MKNGLTARPLRGRDPLAVKDRFRKLPRLPNVLERFKPLTPISDAQT